MIEQRVVQVLDSLGVPYELMQIDPAFADTAACCEKYALPLESAGNTIVVASKKEPRKFGACVVKATRRLDVNHAVRALLGVGSVSSSRGSTTRSQYGFGATAAVGYEFHVVSSVTAGPQLEYGYVNVGDHTSADFASATIGFNWLLPGR